MKTTILILICAAVMMYGVVSSLIEAFEPLAKALGAP